MDFISSGLGLWGDEGGMIIWFGIFLACYRRAIIIVVFKFRYQPWLYHVIKIAWLMHLMFLILLKFFYVKIIIQDATKQHYASCVTTFTMFVQLGKRLYFFTALIVWARSAHSFPLLSKQNMFLKIDDTFYLTNKNNAK